MTFHEWLADMSSRLWPLLANHLWQATLFCAVAFAAILLLRRGSARARYWVWLMASLKFVLPSVLVIAAIERLGVNLNFFGSQSAIVADSSSQIAIFDIADTSASPQPSRVHNEFYCALTFIWLAGFLFFIGRWCWKRLEFSRALRAGRVAFSGREVEALRRVSSWLGTKRDIRLILAPGIIEPGVWRILRPVVVLPQDISAHLSEAELESVMMHELIHVERRDNLMSSLQMFLCCVFWFHPLVWLIDRRTLAESERVCDEKVCELGSDSTVYAASLLKVLRFCIGLRMAGVSSAAGSNLKRRIEQIMDNKIERRSSWRSHALIATAALAVIAFTLVAGVLSRDRIFAGQKTKSRGVSGGVQGGVSGGVPGGVPGGVSGGVSADEVLRDFDAQSSEQQKAWDMEEELRKADEISIRYNNDENPPVIITEARIKAVKREDVYKQRGAEWAREGDRYAFRSVVTILNNSNRRAIGVVIEMKDDKNRGLTIYEKIPAGIEPGASYKYRVESIKDADFRRAQGSSSLVAKPYLLRIDDPSSLVAKVVGVLFDDKYSWGMVLPPPPPPLPPPPPPVPLDSTKAIRKSGDVIQGEAIHQVTPVYPPLARAAQITGSVVVEVAIDEEGNVITARALSGHPLLKDSALEAARQWKFAPTTLEGKAVKVIGSLTFNFAP